MIFETERLLLRPWVEDDAEELYECAKDPRVGPCAGWPAHTSVENSREIIKDVLSGEGTFAICLKETGRPIGSIGLFGTNQTKFPMDEPEIEVGYWVGYPYWGQGIVTEAVMRLQKYVFEERDHKVMWCAFYEGNNRSARTMAKCGFTYHHTEENKFISMLNDYRDEHFTHVTKEEWQQAMKEYEAKEGSRNLVTSFKDSGDVFWPALKRSDKLVLFIHGKGGSADEAEGYREAFKDYDILGFDYKANNPWEAKEEFPKKVHQLKKRYKEIILVAGSIGANFSMASGIEKDIKKAYFISPIVNLEKLISDMITWAGITEEELKERKVVPVSFGDDLEWDYYQYVKKNPEHWDVETYILYGSLDNLQSLETMKAFVESHNCTLTVVDGSEHWLHTEKDIKAMKEWLNKYSK